MLVSEDRYYANVNQDLLAAIPADASRVLELGCGAGALGKAFLARANPEASYVGVELMQGPAALAQQHLTRVVVGNLEYLSNEELAIEAASLDVIVYGDVLEHLVDPWQELAKRRHLLKHKGAVLACIPNVGHWSILAKLMTDQWLYETRGILDRTHLRFFTRATVKELFESAGLKITRIKGLEQNAEVGAAFAQRLSQPLDDMGLDGRYLRANGSVYQWLVKAIHLSDSTV